jgi:O-methyltransferase
MSFKKTKLFQKLNTLEPFKTWRWAYRIAKLHDDYTYWHDGLFTFNNADFLRDPNFIRAYQLGVDTKSWRGADVQWRCYTACWCVNHAKNLEGDFVECGVYKGGLTRAGIEYIGFEKMTDKKWYLLDTFEGFPADQEDSVNPSPGLYADDPLESVKKTFGSFDNVVIIKGRVPETLNQVPSTKIAYLSIDMNAATPEIAAGDFFWDKLVPGGLMLLDDYGFLDHLNQKQAWDAWAKRKNVSILTIPTGQGLVIKPPQKM